MLAERQVRLASFRALPRHQQVFLLEKGVPIGVCTFEHYVA